MSTVTYTGSGYAKVPRATVTTTSTGAHYRDAVRAASAAVPKGHDLSLRPHKK